MAKKKSKASKAEQTGVDGSEEGFDATLERLESLVGELEGGELGLEEAMERFAEGVKLISGCRAALEGFEARVKELSIEAESGLSSLEDLEEED